MNDVKETKDILAAYDLTKPLREAAEIAGGYPAPAPGW